MITSYYPLLPALDGLVSASVELIWIRGQQKFDW